MFEIDKVPHSPLLRLKVTGLVHADDYVDSVPKFKGLITEHAEHSYPPVCPGLIVQSYWADDDRNTQTLCGA